MSRPILVVLSVLALAGCGGPSPLPPVVNDDPRPLLGRRFDGIVGGAETRNHPSVVALAIQGNTSGRWFAICTGTLIAPTTVLTAAHCVEPRIFKDPNGRFYNYGVIFHWVDDDGDGDPSNGEENDVHWYVGPNGSFVPPGPERDAYRRVVKVVQLEFHPRWAFSPSNIADGGDIAVLELEQPVTDVAPAAWNRTPLGNEVIGLDVHHVGFGLSKKSSVEASGAGLKRETTFPITGFEGADGLVSESATSSTCNGDSGGPAFVDLSGAGDPANEVVVAVVSRGPQYCDGGGVDTRTDSYADWVSSTYEAWEGKSCAADGFCRLGCEDGAGNPLVDPDCNETAAACDEDTDCSSRVCNSDPQHEGSYCSQICTTHTDCPSDMQCFEKKCRFEQVLSYFGGACEGDAFCVEGARCLGPEGGPTVCAVDCTPDNTCPYQTQTCVAASNGRKYCTPATPPVIFPVQAELTRPQVGCSATGAGGGLLAALALVAIAFRRHHTAPREH